MHHHSALFNLVQPRASSFSLVHHHSASFNLMHRHSASLRPTARLAPVTVRSFSVSFLFSAVYFNPFLQVCQRSWTLATFIK